MKKCCWLYAKDKINTYSACFIGKSIAELVDDFNQDVGAATQTHDRAYYHEALLNAFEEKGIDVSVVSDGTNISFERRIRFNTETRALEMED